MDDPQNGNTHAFVIEFASVQDRDYYVKTDQAHHAVGPVLSPLVLGATTVDVEAGKF